MEFEFIGKWVFVSGLIEGIGYVIVVGFVCVGVVVVVNGCDEQCFCVVIEKLWVF